MTRKSDKMPEVVADAPDNAPSKYIQKMARAIIGDSMAYKCVDYGSGGLVFVIGSYNAQQQRLVQWGTGKTWAQALRATRRTAAANKIGNPNAGLGEDIDEV